MTNAVLSALPTFHLCTFKMHKIVIHQIDKYRKHCLWRGADINAKTPPKVAWDLVCLPKSEGGLGVLQLEIHNEALLLKNLHKFFNKADIPWVHLIWEKHYRNGRLPNHTLKGSFWWRDILRLLGKFKSCASVLIQYGNTCSLWHDPWCDPVPSQAFPHLFSFTRLEFISFSKARSMDISNLFQLPLSEEAFDQALVLAQTLDGIEPSDSADIWSYRWGHSFSPRCAYLHLIGPRQVHQAYKWLWKTSVQKRHKVFFWLLLKDRMSTRNILRRRNQVIPSYECVLCNLHVEETLEHLFLHCNFARSCWSSLHLFIPIGDPFDVLTSFRQQLHLSFFMDVIIIMSWSIWMARNDFIFNGLQPSLQSAKACFRKEFALVILRAKSSLKHLMATWLEAYV
jgi:hypothetical protein